MISPNISVKTITSEYSDLKILGNSFRVRSKQISQLGFFEKIKIWIHEIFFEKKFIRLDGTQPILIKISELSKKFGISKQEWIKADTKGKVPDLLESAIGSKYFGLPDSLFMEYKKKNQLHYLQKLKEEAEALDLPLKELVGAHKNNRIDEFLADAKKIDRKCQNAFKKLDDLCAQNKMIANPDVGASKLSPQTIERLKKTIRCAFKALSQHPIGSQNISQIIPLNDQYKILAESTPNSFKLTGLFGKILGKGSFGIAVQTIDLLKGTWREDEDAVLKIPRPKDHNFVKILNEYKILEKVNQNKQVLGIQKKVRKLKNVFSPKDICLLGPLYHTNLSLFFKNHPPVPNDILIGFLYQTIHGFAYLHKLRITQGDIKPNNIFIVNDPKTKMQYRLFLSDYGGSVNHSAKKVEWTGSFTEKYRPLKDHENSLEAYIKKDFASYEEIEKKLDVYAVSLTLCKIILYLRNNSKNIDKIDDLDPTTRLLDPKEVELIENDLISAGISQNLSKELTRGLNPNKANRPTALDLFKVIDKELSLYPDLHNELSQFCLINK